MKNIISLLTATFLLSACQAHQKIIPEVKVSKPSMVTRHSEYANGLEQLGELLHAYDLPTIALTVEPINDKTASGGGKIPQDVTMLVESAIQNIGEKVHLMPYGGSALEDAKQNGWGLYAVHGAITEFDANTTSQNSGGQVGMYVQDLDIGADSSSSFRSGTIAMDFLLLDVAHGSYIPGVKATAKAVIENKDESQGFSFSILGNGFGVNGSAVAKSPIHHVVNLMIEYSMIQLVGQKKKLPYWLVLHGADPDYRLMRRMERTFDRKPPENKNMIISYIMNQFDPSIAPLQSALDASTLNAIARFKRQSGLIPPDGSVTSALHMKLLTDGTKYNQKNSIESDADDLLNTVFD